MQLPFTVRLYGHLIHRPGCILQDILDVSGEPSAHGKEWDGPETYSSTAKFSKGAELLHIGQSHVGPCSCNCRYDVASKHWTCRQDIDLHGRSILSVDNGHLSDRTVAVVTISGSRDLSTTRSELVKVIIESRTLTVVNN